MVLILFEQKKCSIPIFFKFLIYSDLSPALSLKERVGERSYSAIYRQNKLFFN